MTAGSTQFRYLVTVVVFRAHYKCTFLLTYLLIYLICTVVLVLICFPKANKVKRITINLLRYK